MLEDGYTSGEVTASPYASKRTVIAAALIPVAVATPLVFSRLKDAYSTTTVPATAPLPPMLAEPTTTAVNVLASAPDLIPVNMPTPDVIQTGYIADTSLEMLANVLDPLIQLMVAISFPIASVIMIGSCFYFMFGNNEKAWSGIMSAGLGYVVIQLSPLFLDILRKVGEAV